MGLTMALLGYGTVGRAIVDIVDQRNLDITIKAIWRRPGATPTTVRDVTDYEALLADPEIDVICEALAGRDPAFSMIEAALKAGKHVVTSNKAAVAADMPYLLQLAHERGVHLLFEASVGGGLPILEGIKKMGRLDHIDSLEGILNGTSNFILDKMARDGMDFHEALREAQRLGYAEADPTADIGGFDVQNKAVIVASLALNAPVDRNMPVMGIVGLEQAEFARAQARGHIIRHQLIVRRSGARFAIGIAPMSLPKDAVAASVHANYNYLQCVGDVVGPLTWIGQGAGGMPTADAVIQDLLNLRDGIAQTPRFGENLIRDDLLLVGDAHFADETLTGMTLAQAVNMAQTTGRFMTFTPSGV